MEKQQLISSPSVSFKDVKELLLCEELNTEEKITALENWKATWTQECASSDEGMIESDEHNHCDDLPIEEIADALRCLKSAS